MALLDTTVYVDLRGRGGAARRAQADEVIRQLLEGGETLATSRVNIAEMHIGVEMGNDPDAERQAIAEFLEWITVLELDDAAAREYARIRADLQKRGRLVGDMDILIGGIALANGQSVVTRNPAHFKEIRGLKVIGYGG